MPKTLAFIKIFYFFENEYNGVMPQKSWLHKEKRCNKLSTERWMIYKNHRGPRTIKTHFDTKHVKYSSKRTITGILNMIYQHHRNKSFILGYAKKRD
jgi:hypothetical protein